MAEKLQDKKDSHMSSLFHFSLINILGMYELEKKKVSWKNFLLSLGLLPQADISPMEVCEYKEEPKDEPVGETIVKEVGQRNKESKKSSKKPSTKENKKVQAPEVHVAEVPIEKVYLIELKA